MDVVNEFCMAKALDRMETFIISMLIQIKTKSQRQAPWFLHRDST